MIRLVFFLFMFAALSLQAQRKKTAIPETPAAASVDTALMRGLAWRCIGPFRGGRSAAVTGVRGHPSRYYFGSTGGGVWRTTDGGQTWKNISDGYFGGSIGAVEVAQSDPNVIYIGGGETTVRGNVSSGHGLWRSVDAGETWTYAGLPAARHIPRIRVHPDNPDIVYAAVLGDLFKDTRDRGIYKSTDGGNTWRQVLFVNERAGAVDLIIDPNNPRILFASTWRVRRTPFELSSGGEGSALWKSKDGGETWTNIAGHKGLPGGIWGISGITVSPANSNRLWAIIENENGGIFRSDDGGQTWQLTNSDRSLRQRAWYYSRIYADPKSEEVVYVVNVAYHTSKDGGRTFSAASAQHGDHHDLWIDPDDPQRMIMGDDGGAGISRDGGIHWTTYHNQPTAQFYRVVTDDHFPFRIYGAQQDNSTVRILYRTDGGSIGEEHWETTAGCECGHLAIDPVNPDIVYGGCYDGVIERQDHETGLTRSVDVWPDLPMGHGAEGARFRFQWNFPIFFSPHDPKRLYAASNHLHVTTNEGQSWSVISPDLTRNDSTKLGPSGGPITKDNTSVEYYCTLFAAAESPRVHGLLWTGSDDGLLHVSRNEGQSWTNVTPTLLPEWIQINSMEPDPHSDGGCYVAATMYKWGDNKPYLLRTKDYGATWTLITRGIDPEHFTRVIRADPKRPGLLYAGTESGVYVSIDDGDTWQPFQLNLPIVPVTDLAVKEDVLIAATQGRSFWVLDDLYQLRQLPERRAESLTLYAPAPASRMTGGVSRSLLEGTNHAGGLTLFYSLANALEKKDTLQLFILDEAGDTVITYGTAEKEKAYQLSPAKGMNKFTWNLRYAPARRFDGMILWAASLSGPKAIPGRYQAVLTLNDSIRTQSFDILKDPRSSATAEDYAKYMDFARSVRDKLTEAHEVILAIRDVRSQMSVFRDRDDVPDSLRREIQLVDSLMTRIEEALYQTKNRSGQDPLNFPIRLTNKLAYLNSILGQGEFPPTEQAYAVRDALTVLIDEQVKAFADIRDIRLPGLNRQIRESALEILRIKDHY